MLRASDNTALEMRMRTMTMMILLLLFQQSLF
jgi:hypothetical protein